MSPVQSRGEAVGRDPEVAEDLAHFGCSFTQLFSDFRLAKPVAINSRVQGNSGVA
jgi:hypothetical protein